MLLSGPYLKLLDRVVHLLHQLFLVLRHLIFHQLQLQLLVLLVLLHQVFLSRHTLSFSLWRCVLCIFTNLLLHVATVFTPNIAHIIYSRWVIIEKCGSFFRWSFATAATQSFRIILAVDVAMLDRLLPAFATLSYDLLIFIIFITIYFRARPCLKWGLHDHFLKFCDIGAIDKRNIVLVFAGVFLHLL